MKVRSTTPLATSAQKTVLATAFGVVTAGWLCGLYGLCQAWTVDPQQDYQQGHQQGQVFATGIPWLESEAACVRTGRVWQEETCWDSEHDPTF
jgi:hypothetical protein